MDLVFELIGCGQHRERLRVHVGGTRVQLSRPPFHFGDLASGSLVLLTELSEPCIGLLDRSIGCVELPSSCGVLLLRLRSLCYQCRTLRLGPSDSTVNTGSIRAHLRHLPRRLLHLARSFLVIGRVPAGRT